MLVHDSSPKGGAKESSYPQSEARILRKNPGFFLFFLATFP